jgi:HPt (histidine-containing phosphotransfer) domain-containing protein
MAHEKRISLTCRQVIKGGGQPSTGGEQPSAADEQPPAVNNKPADIKIPGVNTELGLYLFDGDRDMFLDFLRSFADYIPAELDKLREVTEQSLPEYAVSVHTVKGSGAGIGASDLADLARQLEMMAKAGDLSGVLSGNEKFINDAERLIANIQAFLRNH